MEAHGKDHWDQWLDKALQQYGDAQPRPGLETRILANLADERSRVSAGWWWGLAFADCLATILALCLAHLDVLQHKMPIALNHRFETMHVGPVPRPVETVQPPKSKEVIVKAHAEKTEASAFKRLAKDPRLPQFPAQRPLSKQEQLLKQYVEQFPDEAMVVARVQTEAQKELEKLVRGESSNTEPDQEER